MASKKRRLEVVATLVDCQRVADTVDVCGQSRGHVEVALDRTGPGGREATAEREHRVPDAEKAHTGRHDGAQERAPFLFPARVLALLRADASLRERCRRNANRLGDPSPSGVDFSIAAKLARKRLSGAEIENAIRASRDRAGLPPRPPSYFAATVGKALGVPHE